MSIELKRCSGKEAANYLHELAALRIAVFRDFPYLYDGSFEYEKWYLEKYFTVPESLVILVCDREKIVGASTGLPLASADNNFSAPVIAHGYKPEDIFYFGESVLLKEYRGRGLGHRFFEERESHARKLGARYACFFAVIRRESHPLRPADYHPLETFWKRHGFEAISGLIGHFSWKDIDSPAETEKPMQYYFKALA